ncbi:A24 family peptidase [Corynebacterium sp. p3-SID1056]|uniref:A24 family peptidase n=1 Tax=Corynebacterium sp. p3-SID1056 TaxID=2916092 RepID=UPI0028832DEF|nr:A24 family peptidase [Corynebacterium sp. p3-SID1056]
MPKTELQTRTLPQARLHPMGNGGLVFLALGVFCAWSVALACSDLRRRRLPNALTVPPALACLVACALAPVLAWGLLWAGLYSVAGKGIGGGDVKLAVTLGVVLTALGGPGAVLAAVAVSGAATVVLGLALGVPRLAHGPQMLCAAWIVGTFVGLNGSVCASV